MKIKGSTALISVVLFACFVYALPVMSEDRLLGSYDFAAGSGVNLEVAVTPKGMVTVGDYDGHRLLRMVRDTIPPVEIRDGQQEPEFPIITPEQEELAVETQDMRLNIKLTDKEALGINPNEPENVMVVLKLLDVGYTGTYGLRHFRIQANGTHGRGVNATGVTSGSDWGRMEMTRVRVRERPYLLEDAFLDGKAPGADGFDISIEVLGRGSLLLSSVSIYRADMESMALHEKNMRAMNERQIPLLRKRALVEDRAQQARMMDFYLSGSSDATAAPDVEIKENLAAIERYKAGILKGIEDLETAGDDFYFQGRVAAARGDNEAIERAHDDIAGMIDDINEKLSAVDELSEKTAALAMSAIRGDSRYWWFSPLRTSPEPMPFAGAKINPYERILFISREDAYSYRHSWKMPYARAVGVNLTHMVNIYRFPDETRTSVNTGRHPGSVFAQAYMHGMGTANRSYRHTHLTSAGQHHRAWFVNRYKDETDILTWTEAGEVEGQLNVFNDEVIRIFADMHRAIARRHRFTPKWNLPWLAAEMHQRYRGEIDGRAGALENARSPSAIAKFRKYLKDIYGDINQMNETLGTDYEDFDSVNPPPDMGVVLRRRPGPMNYHFERFRRSGPVEIFEASTQAMKEENPEFLTLFESMGRFDLTPMHGLDTYNFFRVSDMGSTHSQGEFNPIWNMSVQRYFPGSVYGKNEHSPEENKRNCDPDVEMLRAAVHAGWSLELACGNRALGLWFAPRGYSRALEGYGPFLHDGQLIHEGQVDVVPYRNSGESAVFRKRADMLLPLLNNMRWKHPKVGMLYSTTTQIIGWPYQETEFEGLNLHQWLFYSSIPYFVVHEDAIADTRESLGDYRVIIAPYATLTQREIGDDWLDWIRVGGVLLSSGPFGVYDQFGQEDMKVLRAVFGESLKAEHASDEIAATGRNRLDAESIEYLRENGIYDIDSVAGWFWDVAYDELPETARVLLRLEDGRPVLLEGEYEGGRVVFSACGAFANQLGTLYVNQLRRRMTPFAQPTQQYGLLSFPLEDAARRLYLKVINYDLYNTVRDTITLDAAVRRIVDMGLDHGFPVPFNANETETTIDLELDPGRSVLLDLGFEADMTWKIRQINEDDGAIAEPKPDVYGELLEEIAGSGLAPNAKREAWALGALARRWASRGIMNKAEEYVRMAKGVETEPEYISFDGERVRARRVTDPMTIDGSLADWAGHETHHLKGSGVFRAAYDDKYLYLAVVVKSGYVKELGEERSGVNWVYGGHGVEVYLAASDTSGKIPSGLVDNHMYDGYSRLIFEVSGRMRAMPFTVVAPGRVRSATERVDDGYVMEMAIPLEDYYILPVKGASVGFDVGLKGATGTFSRYAGRQRAEKESKRFARLYFD